MALSESVLIVMLHTPKWSQRVELSELSLLIGTIKYSSFRISVDRAAPYPAEDRCWVMVRNARSEWMSTNRNRLKYNFLLIETRFLGDGEESRMLLELARGANDVGAEIGCAKIRSGLLSYRILSDAWMQCLRIPASASAVTGPQQRWPRGTRTRWPGVSLAPCVLQRVGGTDDYTDTYTVRTRRAGTAGDSG